jgi:hypothetical protein
MRRPARSGDPCAGRVRPVNTPGGISVFAVFSQVNPVFHQVFLSWIDFAWHVCLAWPQISFGTGGLRPVPGVKRP